MELYVNSCPTHHDSEMDICCKSSLITHFPLLNVLLLLLYNHNKAWLFVSQRPTKRPYRPMVRGCWDVRTLRDTLMEVHGQDDPRLDASKKTERVQGGGLDNLGFVYIRLLTWKKGHEFRSSFHSDPFEIDPGFLNDKAHSSTLPFFPRNLDSLCLYFELQRLALAHRGSRCHWLNAIALLD